MPEDTEQIGYSYKRYSSPQQGDGDSIRRQTSLARAWCQRNGVRLDTGTTYEDRGKSAFRGKNRETGVLRQFLGDVESGRIPRGSVLLIENMDRLSRERPVVGVNLITGILLAGVRIVQLAPDELELTEDSDLFALFRGQMSQARGHDESKTKSGRLAEVWGEKKADARENLTVQTTRLPAWLEVVGRRREGKHARGGEFRLVPGRAAVVKRIFDMACNGYGLSLIVNKLTAEEVAPWGRGESWSKAYVHKILSGRAVLGDYQPRSGTEADGETIPRYYPPVINEDVWRNAQAALASRKGRVGRVGDKVASLFTGLVHEARTGAKLLIAWQTRGSGTAGRQRARVLVSADSMEGRAPSVSFPYPVFEAAVLSLLREVRPADVIGEEPGGESVALARDLQSVEQRLRAVEAELTGDAGDVPTLARAAKALDQQRQDLGRRLAAARQKEANPRSVAWAETQTLLDVAVDEPNRLRLRGLLRAVIEDVRVLVVPRRSHRLAAVQIDFTGGARRAYLIHYQAAGYRRKGGWQAKSAAWAAGGGPDLDLRDRGQAEGLAAVLATMHLEPVE